MQPDHALQMRRQSVRRCGLANLILILIEQARRAGGRFTVGPFAQDALQIAYRDVHTLVRSGGALRIEPRDFSVIVVCPPLWPFDRGAQLTPFILAPNDFSAPNSNGREICIDLAGVMPELLPSLLYDNLRLAFGHFRLDHYVDAQAAAYVRAHLDGFPSDPRPLYPAEDAR
jgi:hypothetical protein